MSAAWWSVWVVAAATLGTIQCEKYSESDVIPLELLPPSTVNELLQWRQETHQSEASTFAKAGEVRVFGVDMSALCNASVCYSHHWTLFARVVPSPKAFLAADADVVRFVGSLDDAILSNESLSLGSFLGRTAQIAPFALEARPYYVVVRTPRDGEFADENADRLFNAAFRLVVSLVKAQPLAAAAAPVRLNPLDRPDFGMKRYFIYDRLPIDFARLRRSDRLAITALVRPRAPPPALCWKLLDDGSRERCIADKYLNGISDSFVGSRFALCLAANLVHTGRQRSCRMAARRIGTLAARALMSSEAHDSCVMTACDDECLHGAIAELVVQLFTAVAEGAENPDAGSVDVDDEVDSDDDKGETEGSDHAAGANAEHHGGSGSSGDGAGGGAGAHASPSDMSLAANRRLLATPEFQRGVAHVCATTGRRDAGSFSCAAGAGAGLMRAAGGGLRDGFGDMMAAVKTCYGVMKLANRHDLPHFAVEHCNDGVFAEWLRYNAKKQLSYSSFGREIAYMCRSRTRSFEDVSLFAHNEYSRCLEALGRQVALKSGFDYSHSVTLCNQLTSDDRELCLESAKNFTALHEDHKFTPLPECDRSPDNAPEFRSTATLLATPLGGVPPAEVFNVHADWFDVVNYRAWQEGEFVDMLDPEHPEHYVDPNGPRPDTSSEELQRPDGRRRRRRRDADTSDDDEATPVTATPAATTTVLGSTMGPTLLNYSVVQAASLVHASLSRFGAAPLLFYVEWDAQGADLDVEFSLSDTMPTLTAEAVYERAKKGGLLTYAMYIALGVGALILACVAYYNFWLRAQSGEFKSIKEEL